MKAMLRTGIGCRYKLSASTELLHVTSVVFFTQLVWDRRVGDHDCVVEKAEPGEVYKETNQPELN